MDGVKIDMMSPRAHLKVIYILMTALRVFCRLYPFMEHNFVTSFTLQLTQVRVQKLIRLLHKKEVLASRDMHGTDRWETREAGKNEFKVKWTLVCCISCGVMNSLVIPTALDFNELASSTWFFSCDCVVMTTGGDTETQSKPSTTISQSVRLGLFSLAISQSQGWKIAQSSWNISLIRAAAPALIADLQSIKDLNWRCWWKF